MQPRTSILVLLPVFMIRMRTESHDIAIVPINIYGTYIALDANRDGARIVQ